MQRHGLNASLAALLVAMLVVPQSFAAVFWQTPNGTTTTYDYANGNTDNQLFVPAATNPTVLPTGLLFFPSNFRADAANGSAETTSDTLRFEIHVKPGLELSQFIVNEYGDYSILNTGPNTAVKATGLVVLTNLDTAAVLIDTLDTVPPGLTSPGGITSGNGAWTGNQSILNIPTGWTNIQVVLNNVLQAGSDPGTTSFIEKKVVGAGLEIILVIPEPGTISLGLLGLSMLLARRTVRV